VRPDLDVDFYMKTLHRADYWSGRRPDQTKDVIDNYGTDNYRDKDAEKTIEYMLTEQAPRVDGLTQGAFSQHLHR